MKGAKLGLGFSLSSGGGGGGGGGSSYLDSVIASVCCDLDATISDSYSGSGTTWANLIASPSVGLQTDYDFTTGDGSTSSTYPTFTGLAGSNTAYWALDGGDYFRAPLAGIMDTMHRTDQATGFWIARVVWYGSISSSDATFGTGTWNPADIGVSDYLSSGAGNPLTLQQTNGSARTTIEDATLSSGQYYLLITSWDLSISTNNVRFWVNSLSKSEYSQSYTATTTGATETYMMLAATSNEGSPSGSMPNNSRYVHVSMGNEFLDDTKAGNIIAHLETRHGRDYTP